MGNPIPAGYHEILNALMTWGRSGLIPNTGLIKSYHPPSIDDVTGVAVPAPATIFKTGTIDNPRQIKYRSIDELPSASYTGSNVKDFNVNDIPGGPDTNLGHLAPKYGYFYKISALESEDEETYYKNIKQLNIPTVADRMTKQLNNKPVKITDKYEDAKTFYEIAPLVREMKDSEEKTPMDTRKPIPARYELLPTKVPCAIPGVLNCYMEVYDKTDVTQPTYTYTTPYIQMYYRQDKDRVNPDGQLKPNTDQLYIQMATDFTEVNPLSSNDPGDV